VHQVPVVIVPPCINKFYVLDLTPKKSMIRYLLEQGLDTYIISWRNPGADQAGTTFDQYCRTGWIRHSGWHARCPDSRRSMRWAIALAGPCWPPGWHGAASTTQWHNP
jgi:hypothetical protein